MEENMNLRVILAANIFLKAAGYIRKYGWQKSGMSVHGKPRCSMGALASAYQKEKWDDDLAYLMYKSLYDELDGISLTQFNEQVRSVLEVALLFERVASKLKAVNKKNTIYSVLT